MAGPIPSFSARTSRFGRPYAGSNPGDFKEILNKAGKTLVVKAKGGFFKPNFQYLTSYKGFVFYTRTKEEMLFSTEVEFINTWEIWIPD